MDTTSIVLKYKQLISDIINDNIQKCIDTFTSVNKLVKSDNITTTITNGVLELIHNDISPIQLITSPIVSNITYTNDWEIALSSNSLLFNTPIIMYYIQYDNTTITIAANDNLATINWMDINECSNMSVTAEDINGNVSNTSYIDILSLIDAYTGEDAANTIPPINLRAYTSTAIDNYVIQSIEQGFSFTSLIDDVPTTLHIEYRQSDQNNITDNLMLAIIHSKFYSDDHITNMVGYKNNTSSYQGTLVTMQLDMPELLRLFIEAMTHKQMCVIEGQLLKHKLDKATTDEQIYDILTSL